MCTHGFLVRSVLPVFSAVLRAAQASGSSRSLGHHVLPYVNDLATWEMEVSALTTSELRDQRIRASCLSENALTSAAATVSYTSSMPQGIEQSQS